MILILKGGGDDLWRYNRLLNDDSVEGQRHRTLRAGHIFFLHHLSHRNPAAAPIPDAFAPEMDVPGPEWTEHALEKKIKIGYLLIFLTHLRTKIGQRPQLYVQLLDEELILLRLIFALGFFSLNLK
jgi:hypothetical protein